MPGPNRMHRLRAITSVVALYAFVLQVFLGGLMPMPLAGSEHLLCLSNAPVAGDPSPDKPHAQTDCCTAAHVSAHAAGTRIAVASIAWPHRRIATVAFPREAAARPRAPPRSIAHPRGPPTV